MDQALQRGWSFFDKARALLAKKKRHMLVGRELLQGLVDEMAWAGRQILALEKRRDELLAAARDPMPIPMVPRASGKRFWQETQAKVAAMTATAAAAMAAGTPPEPGEEDERPTFETLAAAVDADIAASQAWEWED